METHRTHLMSDAYASIYENRFAAHGGKDTDPGAKYAKPSKGGSMKGVYTMKGKDGKPLFDKKEEVEVEGEEQIDEVAPAIAAIAGKAAGSLAGKAAAGAAGKAGSSALGKAAIKAGSNMVGNKVTQKLSDEFEVSYTELYMEGPKHQDEKNRAGFGGSVRQGSQLPLKNLAPMKRQEAGKPAASDNKGKGKAVKNTVKVPRGTPTQPKRLAKDGPKDFVRGKEHMSKVDMNDPSTKKAVEKMANEAGAKKLAKKAAYKNFANKMEKQRRDDLDKRYGPKKEELECVFAILMNEGLVDTEEAAILLITHMSDDWFDTIVESIYEGEEILDEGKKDACYHKVKSRYDVWPSAYASGALVKCRKAGAKNWGSKSKKD